MKKIFLHIGLPKTGTSYLQKWMGLNRDLLKRHGMWTPEREVYAHRIAVEFLTNPSRAGRPDVQSIKKLVFDVAEQDLRRGLANEQYTSGILSSEYFYECAPQDLAPLIGMMGAVNIQIVIFLRRQDRLIEAGYNQEVKRMGKVEPLGSPRYADRYNWLKLYEEWGAVFGTEAIRVVNYDQASRSNSLLPAFCAALDLPAEIAAQSESAFSDGQNQSLPADLLEFKRLANVFGEFGLDEWLFGAMKNGLPVLPFRLSTKAARDYLAYYEESNRELARRLNKADLGELSLAPDLEKATGYDCTDQLPIQTVARLLTLLVRDVKANERTLLNRIEALERKLEAMAAKPVPAPG